MQRCYSGTVDYTIEALEAGVIQLFFLFVLPLMLSIHILANILVAALTPEPPFVAYGHPPAAPPPPPPPDAVAVKMDQLFDFAFDNPAVYFLCNFAIFLAIALFFLFLEDINKWREVRVRTLSPLLASLHTLVTRSPIALLTSPLAFHSSSPRPLVASRLHTSPLASLTGRHACSYFPLLHTSPLRVFVPQRIKAENIAKQQLKAKRAAQLAKQVSPQTSPVGLKC